MFDVRGGEPDFRQQPSVDCGTAGNSWATRSNYGLDC
jgi:hypothetical protein